MCTTDESHKIRAFLENWSAKDEEKSDECSDSVEKVVRRNTSFVFTVNYKLKREDIESEVFDWLYCYLEERKCPYSLAVALASAVSQSMADEYNSQKDTLLNGGTTHDLSGDELYRESINKVNELCDGYKQDAEEAIKLSAKHSVKPFVVSVCAIKNARRKMEDRHVIIHDMNSLFGIKSNKQYSYYGVFDGHAGIQAATYTASHLHRNLIKSQAFKDGDVKVAIKQAFSETDLHYLERSAREGILSGSTAVCCLFEGRNKLYLAWLGDSQAVLVKNGKPYDIMNPHKPERDDERHRIEEMGGLVSCIDTWRVNGTLAVSRAIGDPEHKPYVSSDPDVEEITLDGSEDYIIMACDGLWDQVTPEEATTIVYQHLAENCESDLNEVAENISEILTDNAKKEGSTDNITVIVLFLRDIQSILSTPFTPPSPKERSLVNHLLDFNENSSLGNPFANGGDINYNSNENEKNLLNSTNHVEAPTPPVDTVLSQNNLNFNYAPFGLNSQLKEDQKSPNPFAEWESTNKPQENVEIRDNSFITSNIAVNEVNQEETERAPQWLDQNSNNPFDSNFQETDEAMPDISQEDDSQANAIPLNDKIDQQFLDFSESKVGKENQELLEEDVSSPEILKAEPIDEPDLCSGKKADNLSFTIFPVPETENKESNLVDFGSGLVCNIENENQNDTSVSKETIEETLKFDEKVEDVPVIKSDVEFSNIENVPLNNDENNMPIENGEPFGEPRTSDFLNYEKTIEDLSEKTLYLSATDVQSEEKMPAEIIPVESQVKEVPQISSEVIEVQQVINEIPELINCSESSLKSDVTVVVHEPLLVETGESKSSELISEADKVVEPEKEKKETVEENVCLTVETNLVHTDDASDADTEKDLEWKFMAVSEPTAVTPVETVKTVEAKVASASKAITKTNTRATTAKTKPLSSQITTATKSLSPVKTTKQGTKTAVATTTSAAASKRPATATATSRTSSTRLSAKPDVTSTTSSTTTTSTATIGNKKVMLTKTTTTRTITKVATTNSASAGTKPAMKTAVASKTAAGKPNGVKAPPLSSVAEKRLTTTTKTVPATTKTTTSSTPVSKTLAASKPAGARTVSQPSKPTVESKVLKKTPTAPSATKTMSDPKTRLSTVAQKRTATAPLGTSKASTNATAAGTKATNLKASPTKTVSRVSTGRIAPKTGSTVKNTTKTDIKPVPKAEMNSESVAEAKEENKESAAVIEEKSI